MPDIQLVQTDPNTGLASLGLGNNTVRITGLKLLAQVVALSFLRNPGQDVIDPTEGAGIRADIGQLPIGDAGQAQMLVVQRTNVVQAEVLARQAGQVLDPTEQLLSLTVIGISPNLQEGQISASVQVTSAAGQTTAIFV